MRTRASTAFLSAFVLLVSSTLSTGCGGAPPNAKTTVLSLENLDSGTTGAELAKAVSAQKGVYRAVFSLRKAEIVIVSDPGLDVITTANNARTSENFDISLGGGHGTYQPWRLPDGVDIKVVSEGGVDVPDLGPHKVMGKITIMDFSAKWCEPCRMLDAHILRLMHGRSDIAYRKLDVADWDTPLALHYMKDVAQLPFLIIFDKSGHEVARITGLDTDRIDETIQSATH